ncbi:2-C-methyl-D-erythritol 4-phosphate cytidylyltransferase [Alteromonadaceae bacterium BrNp21-10]|nr:2-C-methyl-D-erythritol 4-phosphate cytidylyltransferase [Alteromonadaceae bacterium BrNp21-10]
MQQFTVIVPAAGIGSRMAADIPKQYLHIDNKTIIEHTLERLISHPQIKHIVVALAADDSHFQTLAIAGQSWISTVVGGNTRAKSVLAGLQILHNEDWVLVHDAARPCMNHHDLDKLLALHTGNVGGILAFKVRDTMKRANSDNLVVCTESRENLWHALTPQFFPYQTLLAALTSCMQNNVEITDEASAIEYCDGQVILVEGSNENIKITRPDDLALATFYLREQQ